MSITFELLIAAALAACTAFLAVALLRRSGSLDADMAAGSGFVAETVTNLLGLLLTASLAGASGLLVDVLCRAMQS